MKETKFVADVINAFPIAHDQVRVAIITFSTNAQIELHLNQYKTKPELAEILRNIPWRKGSTHMTEAFQLLRNQGLNRNYGMRDNVPHLAVLITDGIANNITAMRSEVDYMKKNTDYKLFAIGMYIEHDL